MSARVLLQRDAGLWLFMAVVSVLFLQAFSAYVARMALADWQPLPTPALAWANLALLAAASVCAQLASRQAGRTAWALAGALALGFVAGQLLLWRQLAGQGHGVASGPAAGFFYLLSGLHAAHLAGGLLAWGLCWQGGPHARRLCARYWHFLLGLWLLLFAVLFVVPPPTLLALCRSL